MKDASTQKTVLLVENEMLIALSEVFELEARGYKVVVASDPGKATEIVTHQHIDIILMDIDLGDQVMDGIDLSEEILKIRNLPILFVSSHNDPKILGKIEKVLSYGFVSKNTDIAVLDTSIKIALKLHAETSPYEGRGT